MSDTPTTSLWILWDDVTPEELERLLNEKIGDKNVAFSVTQPSKNVRGFDSDVVTALISVGGATLSVYLVRIIDTLVEEFKRRFPHKKCKVLAKQKEKSIEPYDPDSTSSSEIAKSISDNPEVLVVKNVNEP